MKRKRKLRILLFLVLLCLLPALPAGAAEKDGEPAYRNTLKEINGKIYYFDAGGEMLKDRWKTVGDRLFYFTKDGSAAVGVTAVRGVRYLFGAGGALKTDGFYRYDGDVYCVNSKGKIQTGWRKNGENQYFFNSRGVMQKDRWIRTGENLFHVDGRGVMQKNRWIKTGENLFHVSSRGVMQKDCWIRTGENLFHVDSRGILQKNRWIRVSDKVYYVGDHGIMQRDCWIDGHYVGKDGVYDSSKKDLMGLKTKMESAIRSYRGSWSVYVKNLDTGQYFSINNRSMYAASLIKLYAMGAVYDRIEQGKISESSVSTTIKNMITVSDNTAFNTIVKKVGLTYINEWCRKNGYTGTNQGHGLSPSSNNYGLRNGSGSNVTSVEDCGKFLESVYRGTCVSPASSQKMLGYLKKQQRRWKIPAGVPGGVVVANKTGETDSYTHDAAIVYSKNAVYILVVMGNTPGSGWSSASNITSLSRMTYNYLNP